MATKYKIIYKRKEHINGDSGNWKELRWQEQNGDGEVRVFDSEKEAETALNLECITEPETEDFILEILEFEADEEA